MNDTVNPAAVDSSDLNKLSKLPYNLYIALVHHPVVNKFGHEITTSVTNLDLHDISRSAVTFGVEGFFVITPISEQQNLVNEVLDHWRSGEGREFNPDRARALERLKIRSSLAELYDELADLHGKRPLLGVTSARFEQIRTLKAVEFHQRACVHGSALIVFGTGHGLSESVLAEADHWIQPIWGVDPAENHLSVRSAVAITLDRLLNGR